MISPRSLKSAAKQNGREACWSANSSLGPLLPSWRSKDCARGCDVEGVVREKVVDGMVSVSRPVRHKVLCSIRDIFTDAAVQDPDMCDCVSRPIVNGIALIFADIMAFMEASQHDAWEQTLASQSVNNGHRQLAEIGNKPCICSPMWLRAKVLYSLCPFDRSIFGQVKNPLFWVYMVLSFCIHFGIRIVTYTLFLALILVSNPDEFQLVQYIATIKGTFFLTGGVANVIWATVGYMLCMKPDGTHTCNIDGPAYNINLVSQAVDLVGSCLLVWIAYACLPWSKHHGWHMASKRDAEAAQKHLHGGNVHKLFAYDFVCILLSAALFWALAYADAGLEASGNTVRAADQVCHSLGCMHLSALPPVTRWDYHRAFLFGRMLYALLSAPFVLFKIPCLLMILTHTTMTGYNRQGSCVAFCLPPKSKPKQPRSGSDAAAAASSVWKTAPASASSGSSFWSPREPLS